MQLKWRNFLGSWDLIVFKYCSVRTVALSVLNIGLLLHTVGGLVTQLFKEISLLSVTYYFKDSQKQTLLIFLYDAFSHVICSLLLVPLSLTSLLHKYAPDKFTRSKIKCWRTEQAVTYGRQLVGGLSMWRIMLDPRTGNVVFVVDWGFSVLFPQL
jgi:hypothetical protein